MLKIVELASVPTIPMEGNRGQRKKIIDTSLGTQAVDVHVNTLMPGGRRGKLHKQSVADNVYIVRSGTGELIVEGAVHTIRKDQIIFIPAG